MRKPYRVEVTCFAIRGDESMRHSFSASFQTRREAIRTAEALAAAYALAGSPETEIYAWKYKTLIKKFEIEAP